MQCPACGRELSTVTVENIAVDVCSRGCGGLWFDAGELKKVDENSEHAGEALLDVKRDPSVTVDVTKRLHCPKCDDIVLMRHNFDVKRSVVVDECPGCGGYWLDAGELAGIRGSFGTDAEREAAADAYFDGLFGGQLAKERAQSEAELATAHNVAKMLRFVCPSYYIPGKQDGAAF